MLRRSVLPFLLLGAVAVGCEHGPVEDGQASELSFSDATFDATLPEVDALGYEIELAVVDKPGAETFSAAVKGTYIATQDLSELSLDFDGNEIDEVTVGNVSVEYVRHGGQLVISLPGAVAKGSRFATRIAYHGNVAQADVGDPNDLSSFGGLMVKQRNAEGRRIFTSLSWPSKARRWLPLRDHPRDAAQVFFRATFPKGYTVLANGKQVNTRDNANGSKTWAYSATTPMPPYAFHVSAYDGWKVDEWPSSSKIPITTYTYGTQERDVQSVYGDLPRALDYYQSFLGPYRWGTVSFVEAPIFGGGMENASVVGMDETLFPDPVDARHIAFHELAHHWSGNLVHFRQWNDYWLSEGFTDYLAAHAVTALDGAEAGQKLWREYMWMALGADLENPHPLAPAGDEVDVLTIFDEISYKKGAWTLRMLEHIVGEPTMSAFLKSWFERHGARAAVSTDDLRSELSAASGRDLTPFFDAFVRGSYHPELRVTFAVAGTDTEVTVEQLQTDGPPAGFVFPLDLELRSSSGRKTRATVDLTGKITTTRIPGFAAKSILVDPDEYAMATTVCGPSVRCRNGYHCTPQRAGISACVPQ